MTTVTESYPLPMRPDERCYPDTLLTPLCPWPQRRRCASQLRPVKNESSGGGGTDLGELNWGPVRHPATGCSQPSPLFPLLFIQPMEIWGWSAGNGDDVVINPEVVNCALAFHLNIDLHLNRHKKGPSFPSRGHRGCPKGLMWRWWM